MGLSGHVLACGEEIKPWYYGDVVLRQQLLLHDWCSVLVGVGVAHTLTPRKVKLKKFSFEKAVQV